MNTQLRERIAESYARVCEEVAEIATKAGREPESVRVVVVTKGHPVEIAQAAAAAGAHDLAENYPEQGLQKIQEVGTGNGVQWHMIGHVQSRKVRMVVEHYNMLHSLDSMKLARRLDRFAGEMQHKLPVLIQANVSGEASKYGWQAVSEDEKLKLAEDVAELETLPNLEIGGLMTMAPIVSHVDEARPFFERLRRLSERLADEFPKVSWRELSMGMSSDYAGAIQEGATLVRIGSAIVGPRPT
ncbi:MAG: YggS family pyridoxal phosphate-dependent enzyme [Chloroflexi bacterium]|nr:MAG: YggS family pyridoxal phosphate-dependent enzyme [Chloroflexota bacterium]MBL1195529.1 YggS family pyridoxal phosphate-dependent enzyme [Chloroflexota bacterium]NOH12811.1 YggS family pyridoxal phosphate-dependent enzyme [Chloroflexota bacterium]